MGGAGAAPVARQDGQHGSRRGQTGRQEQATECPGVAPDRLVGHREQHTGVAGDEEPEDAAEDVDDPAQPAVEQRDGPLGDRQPELVVPDEHLEERDRGEGGEQRQPPHAERHRRPVLEVEAGLVRGESPHHVPEPQGLAEVDDEQRRAAQQDDERDVVAEAGDRLVRPVTAQPEQRGDEVGPAGDSGEEEVEEDEPRPVRVSGEVVDGRSHGHLPPSSVVVGAGGSVAAGGSAAAPAADAVAGPAAVAGSACCGRRSRSAITAAKMPATAAPKEPR